VIAFGTLRRRAEAVAGDARRSRDRRSRRKPPQQVACRCGAAGMTARWMSITTSGSSTITARFIASLFNARPGPEVEVIASAPPNAAPIAAPIAAISSSAWKVVTPKLLYCARSWRRSDAGVIG
jgi:hypothetical protein